MKKSIIVLAAFLLSLCGFAQELKEAAVPAELKSAFQKQFPDTKNITWDKEGKNYEASFKTGKSETSVVMNAQGKILEKETEIPSSQLPKKTLEYTTKNYPNHKIKEAAKIVDTNGKVIYEAEIGGKDLLFDADGNFIKKES